MTTWAARLFIRALDRRLRARGMALGHVPVLLILAEEGALSQKELVSRAAIEQPAMVATLNRMEEAGLVARAKDPEDGRSSIFRLTKAGGAQLAPLLTEIRAVNQRALTGFSPQEKSLLLGMLRRIVENMTDA